MRWWQIRKRDAELERELHSDLELEEEEQRENGLPPEEAHYAARRAFGNTTLIKEQTREAWSWAPFERMLQDLRYALRQFARNPGFACAAVLMLALSVAANTVIFSVVNAVLLKPLPFSHAERLVRLSDQNTKTGLRDKLTGAEWTAWRTRGSQTASGMAAGWDESYTLTGAGEPESLIGYQFTPDIFTVLGSPPALGRPFSPKETHEAILSDSLWEQHFGRSREIVGKTITLNKEQYAVIGVMPKGFDFPGKVDVWTPLVIDGSLTTNNKLHALQAIARLKDGVTIPQAQAAFNSIRVDTGSGENRTAVVEPIRNSIVGDVRVALWIIQAAVLLLVLVAAANTAGILLARATARERELAIRVALGAGRSRIILQFIVEGLTLAAVGGILGLAFAAIGLGSLQSAISENIQLPLPLSIADWIDWRVLAFAVGVSLLSGLFFSIAPALRLPSMQNGALGAGERSVTGGTRTARLRSLLVGLQVAFSLLLLVGSGLLLKSLVKLQSQSFGFRTDHVLTTQFFLAGFDPVQDPQWLADILQTLDRIPGVESAAATSAIPLSGANARRPYSIPGIKPASADDDVASFHMVTPEWFHTMAIPVVRGRTFTVQDRKGAAEVVVMNTTLANRLWPHDNPIGRTITVPDFGTPETRIVIGVVGDTRHQGLTMQAQPEIYRPLYQTTFPIVGIAIHTSGDPALFADTVRRVLLSAMPGQPLGPILTMEDRAASSVALRKESAVMLATFSSIALSLAIVGIYGVVSYSVTRRTKEIGIKMVLGARRRDVIVNVMRRGMLVVVVGTAVGLTASLFLNSLLRALLFDVEPLDPSTLVITPLVLLVVAGIACYLPARRAASVDPMRALRSE
jgi:predicted permease